MAFEIRSWFALHAGCGLDDLRFAGTAARGPNGTIIYYTVDGVPGYPIQITALAGLGRSGRWELMASWPAGTARITVFEKPDW